MPYLPISEGEGDARVVSWASNILIIERKILTSQLGDLRSILAMAVIARSNVICTLCSNWRSTGRWGVRSSRPLSYPSNIGSAMTSGGIPSLMLDLRVLVTVLRH